MDITRPKKNRHQNQKIVKFVNMVHHPKVDNDRLYLPRCERGRSLIKVELTYKTTAVELQRYLQATND